MQETSGYYPLKEHVTAFTNQGQGGRPALSTCLPGRAKQARGQPRHRVGNLAIAHISRDSKRLPVKQDSEEFIWVQELGAVHGLSVLNVACGDGYDAGAIQSPQVFGTLSRPAA